MSEPNLKNTAELIAEFFQNPLKLLGVALLTGLVVWATPYLLVFGLWGFEDFQTASKIRYIESGKVIGQTRSMLDKRYNNFSQVGTSPMAKSYMVAVVNIDHAYYLHVTFDKESGKAVHAILESADEVAPWTKDVSKPVP